MRTDVSVDLAGAQTSERKREEKSASQWKTHTHEIVKLKIRKQEIIAQKLLHVVRSFGYMFAYNSCAWIAAMLLLLRLRKAKQPSNQPTKYKKKLKQTKQQLKLKMKDQTQVHGVCVCVLLIYFRVP